MAPFEADVLTDGEILEDARNHFPGGANAVGNILLGQLLGNEQCTVTPLLRQVHQHIGHPPVDILKGQALHVRGQLAHPLGEIADELAGDAGVLVEHPVKIVLEDNAETALLYRAHRGRAHRIVQQGQLAEIISGALGVHDEFLAVLVAAVDLDLAALDDEQRIGRVILVNDHGVLGKGPTGTARGQGIQFLAGEPLEDFNLLQHAWCTCLVGSPNESFRPW